MPVAEIDECFDGVWVEGLAAVLWHEKYVAFAVLPALGCPAEVSEVAGFEIVIGVRVDADLGEGGRVDAIVRRVPFVALFLIGYYKEWEADALSGMVWVSVTK